MDDMKVILKEMKNQVVLDINMWEQEVFNSAMLIRNICRVFYAVLLLTIIFRDFFRSGWVPFIGLGALILTISVFLVVAILTKIDAESQLEAKYIMLGTIATAELGGFEEAEKEYKQMLKNKENSRDE